MFQTENAFVSKCAAHSPPLQGLLPNVLKRGNSPPWSRRGGCALSKCREASLTAQTGWFVQLPIMRWVEPTTPSAPNEEASQHFSSCRVHPSLTKEGSCSRSQFGQICLRGGTDKARELST